VQSAHTEYKLECSDCWLLFSHYENAEDEVKVSCRKKWWSQIKFGMTLAITEIGNSTSKHGIPVLIMLNGTCNTAPTPETGETGCFCIERQAQQPARAATARGYERANEISYPSEAEPESS
jgi:hypothetical protein